MNFHNNNSKKTLKFILFNDFEQYFFKKILKKYLCNFYFFISNNYSVTNNFSQKNFKINIIKYCFKKTN